VYYGGGIVDRATVLPVITFVAGCLVSLLTHHTTMSIAVIAASSIAVVVGVFVGRSFSKQPVFNPKMMYQGRVDYIHPSDGFHILKSSMERAGIVQEQRDRGGE